MRYVRTQPKQYNVIIFLTHHSSDLLALMACPKDANHVEAISHVFLRKVDKRLTYTSPIIEGPGIGIRKE